MNNTLPDRPLPVELYAVSLLPVPPAMRRFQPRATILQRTFRRLIDAEGVRMAVTNRKHVTGKSRIRRFARSMTFSLMVCLGGYAVLTGGILKPGGATDSGSARNSVGTVPVSAAGAGVLEAPVITVADDPYNGTLWVALRADPGAAINYTLDGTQPSDSSVKRYLAPFLVGPGVEISAIAVAVPDGLPQESPVSTWSDDDLRRVISRQSPVVSSEETQLSASIDRSFGTDGHVLLAAGSRSASACGIIGASDGAIIVAGTSELDNGTGEWVISRLHEDGSPDRGFGDEGFVRTKLGADYALASGLAIQSDGSIVVAGSVAADNGAGDRLSIVTARYMPSGELDDTYGSGGVTAWPTGSTGAAAHAVVLQPDGKILVAGSIDSTCTIVRYLRNGSPDPAFGSGGRVVLPRSAGFTAARTIALQPDGKIVVALGGGPKDGRTSLLRLEVDGTVDESFQSQSAPPSGARATVLEDMVALPDGEIVTVGYTYDTSRGALIVRNLTRRSTIIRYGCNGSVQDTYSMPDETLTGRFAVHSATHAVYLRDGSVFVAGESLVGADLDVSVACFSDSRVSPSGHCLEHFSFDRVTGTDEYAEALFVDSRGRMIVAGTTGYPGNLAISVSRYYGWDR